VTGGLRSWLEHPATRGLELDDPSTTRLRRDIVRTKPFLRRVYLEWYDLIRRSLPDVPGPVVELGSGAGFFEEVLPGVIASEVFLTPGVQVVLDGQRLPFAPASLRAIVMTNVFHHLPDCRLFLASAARCVRPGGAIVMVEPWVSRWSRFVYRRLHHEPFDPDQSGWPFPGRGPLSGANGALPWIVFQRDRAFLEIEFPQWLVARVNPLMPFRYLASGGVSLRSLAPGWSFSAFRAFERALGYLMPGLAMFALLVVERTAVPASETD
jgi:SAM-dependent methyltransferase